MRRRSRPLATSCVLATALAAGHTWAQEPADVPSTPGGAAPPTTGGVEQAQRRPYWSAGKHRPFLAATFDVGLWYARANLAAGWGKPHWRWLGIETQSRISSDGASEYAGLHFALPRAELRVGGRYFFATDQAFLEPDNSYTDFELELERAPQARYYALEAELGASAPFFGARLFGLVGGMYLLGVTSPYYVFEESLHVVVAPPWAWRGRGGLLVPLDKLAQLHVGAACELIGVPERDLYVVRAGPVFAASLTHHLEAQATLLLVIHSRDDLGIAGGEFGQLGVRYRWATGDPFPEFP